MGGERRRIADIQPFALLHDGAITSVYKGYQSTLDRFVLLKVLKPAFARDEALVERFEAEAQLVARVQHPNVVAVYTFGRDAGQVYMATEFVDGTDGAELVERGPLPVELAAYIFAEVAAGLAAAHQRSVLHQDVKPANMLVSHEGRVKLADFGMASLVDHDDAELRGTPAYMAPEQLAGGAPSPASDLFGLGAMFYALLTGRSAFERGDTDATVDAVLHYDPLPSVAAHAEVPSTLLQVLERLLAKRPEERHASAAEVVDELQAARMHLGWHAGAAELSIYLEDPAAFASVVTMQDEEQGLPVAPDGDEGDGVGDDRVGAPAARRPARSRLAWGGAGVLAVVLLLAVAALGYGASQWFTVDGAAPESASAEQVTPRGQSEVVEPEPERPQPAQEEEGPVEAAPVEEREPRETAAQSQPGPQAVQTEPAPEAAQPAQGRLTIQGLPWAEVYVDGQRMGTTPPSVEVSLTPGRHVVELRHPELPQYRDTVQVEPGEAASLRASLWEQVARLTVRVSPWAEVLVDGTVRDTTPVEAPLTLTPGQRRLTLRHPALGTLDTMLTVDPGALDTLRVNLYRRR